MRENEDTRREKNRKQKFIRNMYIGDTRNQRNEETKKNYKIHVKLKINEGISPKYESSYKQATRQTKT